MDIDVQIIATDTLKNKIDKILENQAFLSNLKSKGLAINHVTKPKQTETTQRWKMSINAEGIALPIPTKIEFSRRNMEKAVSFEAIDSEITQTYKIYPILTNHYTLDAAFEQKVKALIYRTETQARDIFDLSLLLDKGAMSETLSPETQSKMQTAIENAITIGYSEYISQVVAFLDQEYQDYYKSDVIWQKLQDKVIRCLEQIKKVKTK